MDSHSRSNQNLQEMVFGNSWGFSFNNVSVRSPIFDSSSKGQRAVFSNQVLIIGKAYNEPSCCNHLENMLLQREYIID